MLSYFKMCWLLQWNVHTIRHVLCFMSAIIKKLTVYQVYVAFVIIYFFRVNKLMAKANNVVAMCILPALVSLFHTVFLSADSSRNYDSLSMCRFPKDWIVSQHFLLLLIVYYLKKLPLHYAGRTRCYFGKNRSFSGPSGTVKAYKCSEWCILYFTTWSIWNNK